MRRMYEWHPQDGRIRETRVSPTRDAGGLNECLVLDEESRGGAEQGE